MAENSWNLSTYRSICDAAKAGGYKVITVHEYLSSGAPTNVVLFRHDVDRFPGSALAMAQLEHEHAIRSTYYIRLVPTAFDASIVESIAGLGHEIGYHYETLSKTGGDYDLAAKQTRAELRKLRALAEVTTAAAHGSPLSSISNQGLWDRFSPADFGLIGEAYRSIDYSKMAYYTDTGRAWDAKDTNIRDVVEGQAGFPTIPDSKALIDLLGSGRLDRVCVQTHPERWAHSLATAVRSSVLDRVVNTAKYVLKKVR